jgi:hypothetical protein
MTGQVVGHSGFRLGHHRLKDIEGENLPTLALIVNLLTIEDVFPVKARAVHLPFDLNTFEVVRSIDVSNQKLVPGGRELVSSVITDLVDPSSD